MLNEKKETFKAICKFKVALLIKPDFSEASNNLANTLFDIDKTTPALRLYKQALVSRPTYFNVFYNLGACLTNIIFTEPQAEFYAMFKALLKSGNYVRPRDISAAITSSIIAEKISIKC